MAVKILPALLRSIDGGWLDGRLGRAGVTVATGRLPADRIGEYRPASRRIVIDEARARRSRGGVVGVLAHEAAHALTSHLKTPEQWHNAEFERVRCGLALDLWAASRRYARRKKERPMQTTMPSDSAQNGNMLPIRGVASRVEIRKPGALSVEQQLRAIRRWERDHPVEASIRGIRFTVGDDGTVRPHYEENRPRLRVRDAAEKMRARAARW